MLLMYLRTVRVNEWEIKKKTFANTMQCVNQPKDEGHQTGTYTWPLLRLHGSTKKLHQIMSWSDTIRMYGRETS